MIAMRTVLILFIIHFHASDCVRRIINGTTLTTDKRYMVYLFRAPEKNEKQYNEWLCGGALVSTIYILTSAACVEDVSFIYALAGYKKYIEDKEINKDKCTKAKKKKIVYICVPRKYDFKYDKLEKWTYLDLALAKVESPYNFNDNSYKTDCSYIPTQISINFDYKYQKEGVDAFVLGWGHTSTWRMVGDYDNYNEPLLRYASTVIMPKSKCIEQYKDFPNLKEIIQKFMICTIDKGKIDDKGHLLIINPNKLESCDGKPSLLFGKIHNVNGTHTKHFYDHTRREVKKSNKTSSNNNTNEAINGTGFDRTNHMRRYGICQNDHGGPLVTWVGSREVVIGVASMFKVALNRKCVGPFLYTSTHCAGAFLHCMLYKNKTNRRIYKCDSSPLEKGFDIIENHISWEKHPDGPADNERTENK